MGGGASVPVLPEILSEEQFKLIAGNLYSKDLFDQLKNSDGKVTRANLLHELKVEYNPSVDLRIIPWEQLFFDSSEEIGRGSFGYVYQALWVPRNNSSTGSKAVAVKVMTRVAASNLGMKYNDELIRSREEATRVLEIAQRGGEAVADAIIKVYGFAEGPLPTQVTSKFSLLPGEEAFGVVMRLEAGGSLDSLLHTATTHLSMADKMHLICLSVAAIAELHYIGVIHADLKPANFLLARGCAPWELRVADFGMAEMRELVNKTMAQSTMRMTSGGMKGTPMYCAPELILEDDNGDTAKPSRLTDIYALAMLIWEILSRKVPFGALKNIGSLMMKLAKGDRPPLDIGIDGTLPLDTPPAIVDMIGRCWDTDRSKRMFAVEMTAVAMQELAVIEKGEFDVFFSHRWASKAFLCHLHALLTKLGYRVWYDQAEMGWDLTKSMNDGVKRSKVVLACVDKGYQDRPNCMLELRAAKALVDPIKPVVTVLTQGNPTSWGTVVGWANDEMIDLCDFQKKMYVDLSALAGDPGWVAVDGPSEALLKKLAVASEPLLKILHDLGCQPSVGVTCGVAARRLMSAADEREKQAKIKAEQAAQEQDEREDDNGVGKTFMSVSVASRDPSAAVNDAATAEIAAIKTQAEQVAKGIKAEAEREAKEQADRVNASTSEIKAKAEREIAEMKAKAEKERKQQVPAKAAVRVVGATGSNAYAINGMYEATTELSGDMPVYRNVDDGDRWLEYHATLMSWQVKPTAGKGTNTCTAYCVVPVKCLPQDCPPGQWKVIPGFDLQPAVTISVVTQDEVESYLAELQREAARAMKGSQHVRIAGATGPKAGTINGMYRPTQELCNNVTVYVKVDDGDGWLEYHATLMSWQVKPTAGKGTNTCTAYCVVPVKCLPQDCLPGQWKVYDGTTFDLQPAVTISVVTQEEVEAYLAEVKREAARVVKGTQPVRIAGATGPKAGHINGMYKPMEALNDNLTVYVKVGDGSKRWDGSKWWLMYKASDQRWNVQTTYRLTRRVDVSDAYCAVPVKCLPQDCPPGQWRVYDGDTWGPQPAVTISVVTQKEVEAYLAELKSEAVRLVKGSQHVRITGATGSKAGNINGMYKPTQELRDNVTVYVKVEDGDMWLEYHAVTRKWQVKTTAGKGEDGGWAYCAVPVKCLPEKCPAGQWQVGDGTKFDPQPAITISVVI